MSSRSLALGIPISISRSSLPGLRRAGSKASGRLVAANTITWPDEKLYEIKTSKKLNCLKNTATGICQFSTRISVFRKISTTLSLYFLTVCLAAKYVFTFQNKVFIYRYQITRSREELRIPVISDDSQVGNNTRFSYSRYWTGTSIQLRLMRRSFQMQTTFVSFQCFSVVKASIAS